MSFTPDWCIDQGDEDCLFYETKACETCERCTFCGAKIGPRRRNGHRAHLYIAESKGGRTWVPACPACNMSQGDKGLIAWLGYLCHNNPQTYELIRRYQKIRTPFIGLQMLYSPERHPRIWLGWRMLDFYRRHG
jgi:hypothetical protein